MSSDDLGASIERGVEFLRRSQLPSGEFKVFMSPDLNLERDCFLDSSLFPTALIAYALGFADPAEVKDILDKALDFLLGEMGGPGLWRYWTKRHQTHSISPPDLDDTACVSFVLRRHNLPFPPNLKLILANRNREGLFYTWLTARWPLPLLPAYWRVVLSQWLHPRKLSYFWTLEPDRHDVDCVVNANVLFYVGETPETQPVINYLLDVLRRGEEGWCDRWYLNPFVFYYAVARNFHAGVAALGGVRDESVARIVAAAKPDGSVGDGALNTALAICALLYWRSSPPELERAVRFLLAEQRADGSWQRAAVYYSGTEKHYAFGSEELITGFCLEALLHHRLRRS
ncbi:MAG: hypothetical protein ACJ741_05040 [Pyrinomonadaceae bacterium]